MIRSVIIDDEENSRNTIFNILQNYCKNITVIGQAGGVAEGLSLIVKEEPDGSVITIVRDTGRGITPSNIDKIFDRFFTTEPRDREKPYGSGLGLAIARSIIENHGGTIWVENEPKVGATFSFTLS